jgi:cob(I)alamin adenosyltransferase
MDNGVVQIYYGEGHGKSTAALGSAIQLAGDGKTVIAIQFMKRKIESETELLKRLEPEIRFFRFAKSDESFETLTEEEKQEERINLKNGFNYGKKVVSTGACDLLIMDELLGVLDEGVVTMEDIADLIRARPEEMSIIFTGRVLPEEMRPFADEIYNIAPEKQVHHD